MEVTVATRWTVRVFVMVKTVSVGAGDGVAPAGSL